MSNTNPELVEKFTAMAKAVAATVAEVPNREEAFKYIIDLTLSKEPCELLADEPGTEKGPLGPNRVPTRVQRVIAAPSLDDEAFAELDKLCQEKGILCLRDNVRKYAAGIDLGQNFLDVHAALTEFLAVEEDGRNSHDVAFVDFILEQGAVYHHMGDVRVDDGHQIQCLYDFRAVLAAQGNIGLEPESAFQVSDLFDDIRFDFRGIAAGLKQGQNE